MPHWLLVFHTATDLQSYADVALDQDTELITGIAGICCVSLMWAQDKILDHWKHGDKLTPLHTLHTVHCNAEHVRWAHQPWPKLFRLECLTVGRHLTAFYSI